MLDKNLVGGDPPTPQIEKQEEYQSESENFENICAMHKVHDMISYAEFGPTELMKQECPSLDNSRILRAITPCVETLYVENAKNGEIDNSDSESESMSDIEFPCSSMVITNDYSSSEDTFIDDELD